MNFENYLLLECVFGAIDDDSTSIAISESASDSISEVPESRLPGLRNTPTRCISRLSTGGGCFLDCRPARVIRASLHKSREAIVCTDAGITLARGTVQHRLSSARCIRICCMRPDVVSRARFDYELPGDNQLIFPEILSVETPEDRSRCG
jgi:hypothetical protein